MARARATGRVCISVALREIGLSVWCLVFGDCFLFFCYVVCRLYCFWRQVCSFFWLSVWCLVFGVMMRTLHGEGVHQRRPVGDRVERLSFGVL